MSLYLKRTDMPDELEKVYVDFYWSQRKLWSLLIPTVEIEIQTAEWILDYPIWYIDAISIPRKILESPSLDLAHAKRVEDADLSYPIHGIEWKGRYLILDGIHRLMKAKQLGHVFIKAKTLTEQDIQNILPDEVDFESGFLKQVLDLQRKNN